MTSRFIIIRFGIASGSMEITKQILIEAKQGNVEHVIDTLNGTCFDPQENAWKPLPPYFT